MPIVNFVVFKIIEPFEDTTQRETAEILINNGLRLIYVLEGSRTLREKDFEVSSKNKTLYIDFEKKIRISDDLFSYYVLGISNRPGLVLKLELWLGDELVESRNLTF